jgi:hypothetical protein
VGVEILDPCVGCLGPTLSVWQGAGGQRQEGLLERGGELVRIDTVRLTVHLTNIATANTRCGQSCSPHS